MSRPLAWLIVAGVALLGAAPAALASAGVSVDVGRMTVDDVLPPGGEYRLPAFGVRNPGTEPTAYRLVVSHDAADAATRAPDAWFAFEPADLVLAPGASRPVVTRLELPPDAEPGTYVVLVGPEIVASGGGATVGAGAAVRLTFTVGESGGLAGWLRLLGRLLDHNPWVLPAATLAGLYVLARSLRGRFSVTVTRRA